MVEFFRVENGQQVAHWVPDYCASILDKKVHQAALSCFESFVDWLLTHLSSNYNTLLDLKDCQMRFGKSTLPELLHFPNGVPLYSFTLFCEKIKNGFIIHNRNLPVHFNKRLLPKDFSGADYVVMDLRNRDDVIEIRAYEKGAASPAHWEFDRFRPTMMKNQLIHWAQARNDAAYKANDAETSTYSLQNWGFDVEKQKKYEVCNGKRLFIYTSQWKIRDHDMLLIRGKILQLPEDESTLLIRSDLETGGIVMHGLYDPRTVTRANLKDYVPDTEDYWVTTQDKVL